MPFASQDAHPHLPPFSSPLAFPKLILPKLPGEAEGTLPACLWGCGRLRGGPCGLFPCCRNSAAPLTIKKLSLKLQYKQAEQQVSLCPLLVKEPVAHPFSGSGKVRTQLVGPKDCA